MNDKHTQSHNKHNKLQNQSNHGSNLLKSINLSVSVTIHLFAITSKLSLPENRVLRIKGALCAYSILKCDSRSIVQWTH